MALLTILEFPGGPPLGSQIPDYPEIARQSIPIGGTSAVSQAFNEATKMIRMHTDVNCAFRIGAAGDTPTALVTDGGMTAGQTEFGGVKPGAKIAVILTP